MEPYEQLRDELAWHRDGDQYLSGGMTFSDAWRVSVEQVCKRLPDGDWWRSVFASQCETWRRHYGREPLTRGDMALALLAAERGVPLGLDDVPTDAPQCAHCDGPIPEDRRPGARYCSDRCRRDAAYERERATDTHYSHAA